MYYTRLHFSSFFDKKNKKQKRKGNGNRYFNRYRVPRTDLYQVRPMGIYAAGYLSAGCLRYAFATSTQRDVALLAVHEAVARKHVWSVLARLIREIR